VACRPPPPPGAYKVGLLETGRPPYWPPCAAALKDSPTSVFAFSVTGSDVQSQKADPKPAPNHCPTRPGGLSRLAAPVVSPPPLGRLRCSLDQIGNCECADPRPAPPRPPTLYTPWRIRLLLTLRTKNPNDYISRTGIKMRSGQYAALRQDADTGAGVVRSFDPGSVTRGTACLTQVCVQAVLKAILYRVRPAASSRPRSSASVTFVEVLMSRRIRS
jgi:hypothetical protein